MYIDLICHGVPSYNLYRKYKRRVAKKYGLKENGIVTKFRYKDKGWRTIRLHSTDGEKSVCFDQWEDMYFRAFETGGCYSVPCYECRYRDRSDADIRIGDYWGPRFENDRTGVNMVSVFTEVGEQMMRALSGVKGCNIGLQSANDYSSYQQTLNIPEPLFYNEYLRRLSDEREDISGILRRYCAPFEKFEPDRKKRLMRFIMTATDENLYRRRRSRRK